MTAEEYSQRSNVLSKEAERLRGILDEHAVKRARGIVVEGAHIDRARMEFAKVFEDFATLDREYWGQM